MQISINTLLLYSFGITLVALVGGIPPLFRQWNQRQLHLFVAFGGGTILGAIFFHLLPDALSLGTPDLTSSMILVGFVSILLIERILLREHHHHDDINHHDDVKSVLVRHEIVGITAMVGLSVHTMAGGFGLAAGLSNPEIGLVIFIAIIAHKGTEAFSLSTIFRLAEFSKRKTITLLILYSLMTPFGALISLPFINKLGAINLSIPTGLTAGTFLYVATLDLIPEAFHGAKGRFLPFTWMMTGILIMYILKFFGV
jgi:zinc and cadmium transporter